jgi:hypothetical protein
LVGARGRLLLRQRALHELLLAHLMVEAISGH